MKIIDRGVFNPYVPSAARQKELGVIAADPDKGNQGVLFAQNESGCDFYEMELTGVFSFTSILVSVDDGGRIVSASFAGSRVVPHKGSRLYELQGDDLPTRLEELSGKIVDPATGLLVDSPPPQREALFKTEIYSRMTDAELDQFEDAMAVASTRVRLMWRDCNQVEVASPFWPLLKAQLTHAFGANRTDEILSLKF